MTDKVKESVRQHVQKLKRDNSNDLEKVLPQALLDLMVEDWNTEFEQFPDEQITQADLLESMGLLIENVIPYDTGG